VARGCYELEQDSKARALGEIACLRGGPTPSPRRNGQSGGRRTDADSGQRCSHHKFESRAWVSLVVPRDPVKQEALEAGGNRRGSGRWIVRTQSGQSDHDHRHQYFAPPRQSLPKRGVVTALHKENQPRSGRNAIDARQVIEEPAERLDELLSRSRAKRSAVRWHVKLYEPVHYGRQQRLPRPEVVGGRTLREAGPLVDAGMCECPEALSADKVDCRI
jgi:hypothetical protein